MLKAISTFFRDLVVGAQAAFEFPPNMELHHWRIEMRYRQSPRGAVITTITLTASFPERRTIGDFRALKCKLAPMLICEVPRNLLCNGVVEVEPKCYLGEW